MFYTVGAGRIYREDFDEAQDRALEAARWYERYDSHRSVAIAYSMLYSIAHDWTGDLDVARFYARRVTMSAHLANDVALEHWGLLAQIGIASECGRCSACPFAANAAPIETLNEQYYRERVVFVLAEVLVLGGPEVRCGA